MDRCQGRLPFPSRSISSFTPALTQVFLIDFISIALAVASGVVFGGVFEGGALSAVGATLGSLVAFQLSRTLLQERAAEAMEKQPIARALGKVRHSFLYLPSSLQPCSW